jgi:hypothetical protein
MVGMIGMLRLRIGGKKKKKTDSDVGSKIEREPSQVQIDMSTP